MNFIDRRILENQRCIEEVIDSNKTEKRGDDCSEAAERLGAFISQVNRKKLNPAQQRKLVYKLRLQNEHI
jgi:hypothetical protein